MNEEFKFSKDKLVTSYIVQQHTAYNGGYWTRPVKTNIDAALKKIDSVRGGPRIGWGRGTEHWDGRYCFKTEEDARLMYETLKSSHPKEDYRIVKVVATQVEPKRFGES